MYKYIIKAFNKSLRNHETHESPRTSDVFFVCPHCELTLNLTKNECNPAYELQHQSSLPLHDKIHRSCLVGFLNRANQKYESDLSISTLGDYHILLDNTYANRKMKRDIYDHRFTISKIISHIQKKKLRTEKFAVFLQSKLEHIKAYMTLLQAILDDNTESLTDEFIRRESNWLRRGYLIIANDKLSVYEKPSELIKWNNKNLFKIDVD